MHSRSKLSTPNSHAKYIYNCLFAPVTILIRYVCRTCQNMVKIQPKQDKNTDKNTVLDTIMAYVCSALKSDNTIAMMLWIAVSQQPNIHVECIYTCIFITFKSKLESPMFKHYYNFLHTLHTHLRKNMHDLYLVHICE